MIKPALYIISRQTLLRQALSHLLSGSNRFREINGSVCFSESRLKAGALEENTWFIIDAELPDYEIQELLLLANRGGGRVIILGSSYNAKRIIELMPLKADGYLTTDSPQDELFAILEKVESGGPVIADSLIPDMMNRLSASLQVKPEKEILLTPREQEILELLAQGYTNGQIAKKLIISVNTVKNHVHNILEKLGVSNRAKLVSYAMTRGLVSVLLVALVITLLISINTSVC